MEMVVGHIYWYFCPSDENKFYGNTEPKLRDGRLLIKMRTMPRGFDGGCSPDKPYMGLQQRDGLGGWEESCSTYVTQDDLYESREDALPDYRKALLSYADTLREEIKVLKSHINALDLQIFNVFAD